MSYYTRIFIVALTIILSTGCRKNNISIPSTLSVFPVIDTIGGTVTITGTGFSQTPDSNIVMFNDSTSGIVLTATNTQLTVKVPAFITEGKILVTTNNQKAQTSETFKVAPKFYPQSEAPGYPITIVTGGGLNLADFSVSFNGVTAQPSGLMNDLLTVTVPANAVSGKVTVNYKGSPYTSLTDFTVAPVGIVTNVSSLNSFIDPTGIAFDKNGNLLVADIEAGYINKVNMQNGAISVFAGNGLYASNQSGPLLTTGIYGAFQLAFAPNGNLYSTNPWYGSILKFTTDSVIYIGNIASKITNSSGLCIDASGNLYFSTGQQIYKLTSNGCLSVIAGTGLQGHQNGPALTAQFISANSLLLDNEGSLYIGDNTMLRKLSNGMVNDFAGGGGNGNFTDGTGFAAGFISISSIAIDPISGNIYAACSGEHVVRRITPAGVVTTIAGNPGQKGSQNGTGASALFEGPSGIALDGNGNIYVSDGSYGTGCIRKIQLH
jgi:IPT/TIG domain./NHL repeat./SMP-30/Gluconolaconase/LRE-like region.